MSNRLLFVVTMLAATATAVPHDLIRRGIFHYVCDLFSSRLLWCFAVLLVVALLAAPVCRSWKPRSTTQGAKRKDRRRNGKSRDESDRVAPLSLLASSLQRAGDCSFRWPYKDGFGEHHVDALVAVDELGDVEVGGDAREHVGVVARKVFFGHEEIDHLADGKRGTGVQV